MSDILKRATLSLMGAAMSMGMAASAVLPKESREKPKAPDRTGKSDLQKSYGPTKDVRKKRKAIKVARRKNRKR